MLSLSSSSKANYFAFRRCWAFSSNFMIRRSKFQQQQQKQQRRFYESTSLPLFEADNNNHPATDNDDISSNNINNNNHGLILPSMPDKVIKSVMAPMVAASDFPFRCLVRNHGVDLCFTQMLHSKNLVRDKQFRKCHFDFYEVMKSPITTTESNSLLLLQKKQWECLGIENYNKFLNHDNYFGPETLQLINQRHPLIVQLAGHDPNVVVKACHVLLDHYDGHVDGIDLNLGCPQQIAKKGNYGAFLAENDFDLVCEILTKMKKTLPSTVALSAKIRLPTCDQQLQERIPKLLSTGINFLTIHGRTLQENKTKVGPCHVNRIRLAIDTAHKYIPNFPIIANGGIEDYHDIQQIQKATGAAAIMSSEALLETPNVFRTSCAELTPFQTLQQQFAFSREYIHYCKLMPPLPGVLGKGGSFGIVRAHLFKFLHRYLQEHVDLRNELGGPTAITTIPQAQDLINELESRYVGLSCYELSQLSSSLDSSWYRRHRKPDRRVHQKQVMIHSNDNNNIMTTLEHDKNQQMQQEKESIESRKALIRKRISKLKKQGQNNNFQKFVNTLVQK